MRYSRTLALGASLLALLSACTTGGGSSNPPTSGASPTTAATSGASPTTSGTGVTIKLGSVGFYEAKLVAEMYGQALESKGFTIDRTGIGLGGRPVVEPAINKGTIDLQPEYIGSRLGFYDTSKIGNDPAAEKTALQAILDGKGGGLTVLDYAQAADNNGFVVRPETATQYNLTKLSDVAAVQDKLKFGLALECPTNPICGPALKSAYGFTEATINNASLISPCDQPMVDALANKTVDLAELCTTQPDVPHNGWVLLADDKNTQPADNIAPIVRNDLLAKVDATTFKATLNSVSAKLTTAGLLALNQQIVFDKKDIAAVAKQWLKDNGIVP